MSTDQLDKMLPIAVKNRSIDVAKRLIANGAKIKVPGRDSSFLMAVRMGDSAMVDFLLEEDQSLFHDHDVSTHRAGLHIAARRGTGDLVKKLLDWGVSKDEKDDEGRTALHMAVEV